MSHAPPFRIDSNARVLQFAAHTFDASLVDVLTTLIHGGCVCVPSESARLNDTINVINDMRVNHATFTPSFIGFIDPSSVPGLKTVMLAGEAMSPSHLTTWSNRYLINAYGPTESSVSAAVNPGLTTESDCRDIGHAIGVRSWIVNPENHDQLVPVGCSGELILEGPTLARGYINNKSKTDEAFIYDPGWSRMGTSKTGRRFYKTGDLVRYSRDNGCLAYLGRKDTQIKIHGQRVELGEIENHLNAYAKVKHCLVLFPKSGFSKGKIVAVLSPSARDDTQHDSGLMPFQLLDQRTRTDFVAEARQRLSVQLPRHMVPTVWLCLEALPFLTSGKLDRKSVATWLGSLEDDPTLQVAKIHSNGVGTDTQPTTEVETQLASVWSRILNVPVSHISLNDSFLGLGGDSIAAITCTSHCKKLGIGLTVQDILHSKSVKELAGRVKAVNRSAVYKETVEEPFDLSPIQNLHFRVRREGQGHFNQSILTRINKNVDVKCLQQAIETLVMRHSMLRARFTDSEGAGVRQRITQDIAGSFHFLVHNAKGNEVVKQAISDSQARMNSISGPVLGIDLFTVKGKDPLLFMTAHHLVVDIVSWRIILEDLEDLLLNPRESAPQNGSLPFQTWCRLQADQCRTASTEKPLAIDQLPDPNFAYWGMENSPITYGDAACETFDIGTENTSSILRGCHQSLRTEPVDIFLAALLQSFNQTFKDRASPVIYNEGHGREVWDSTIDISRTVGWFTTLSPIFIPDLDFDSPHKNVMRVKDLRRRAANNGREDFARRVLTNQETKCGQPSPMEISFNYVGQHRDLQRQDGLFQLVEHMAGEAGQGGKVADFGEETPRFALFETSAMVVDGRLRFSFSFNKFMRHQEAIRGWISQCRNLLISMAEQLPSLPPQPTLSDFPMLSLTYENLDTMVSDKLSSAGIESLDSVEDIYPCSRLQQVLLLNHYRDSSLYIVHGTFEVRGVGGSVPDLNRLGLAWQQVVSHHAMLRTVFVESLTECDLFSQVVLRSFSSQPTYTQCSDEGDGLRALDAQPPMDHRQYKPMHRFSICQTASGKLFCRVELSHAVMDGASISVILRDLQLAYSGTLDTIRRPLFKNFIQCLQDSPHKAGLDYWCSYLSNVRPCNFPVLNDGKDSQRRLQCLRLNFGLFKELRKFSETSGITLSTAFNVAWGLTLRSYCGSDDVCFGYMVSLRDLPVEQIESIVGPVVNLMACRMNMAGGSALTDVLHQVQDDYMESLPYRHSSLVDIQHALKLSDTALFNTGVSYQKIPAKGKYDKRDIEFQEACPIHDPAEFPVFLNIEVTDDDAQVELNYWATTLSDNQAENLASTFLQSLENIIHHQGSEISRLESLSERDKQQIRMWNANIGEAVDECIHEVLDFKAKSRPDAPAVITHDEQLTYFELNESSSRLAAYISMLGVGPGVLVPIDFDKSKWMVVAIVAVLKTGAGCIPLHRHYSWAYLEKWMNGHGVQVALAASDRAELLECSIPYVVTVDSSLFEYLPTGEEQRPSISPSDTAYVLPAPDNSDNTDCVILDHSVILTRATSFSKILGINSETRLLQHFAYTSDMFLQEVFGPLVHGGCVCFAPDDFLGQIPALANQLQANFISTSPLVAASFTPSDIPGVNAVAFSGERISRRTRTTWGTKMHALYGTSETSSACITSSGNDDINEIRKIGSNVACASWVVDPSNHHCLVPIGCVGELLTEGPILACGYLENSQAENNFIEDPEWISAFQRQTDSSSCAESRVSATQKRQMFRTGDLVRYNSDGSMVYVGRKSPENERGSSLDTWQVEDSIETVLSPNQHCAVEWVQHYDAEEEMKCLAAFVFLDAEPVMDLSNHRSLIEPISPRSQELIATIHTHVQSCMSASQTPRLYFPVFKMPFDPMGRLNRQALQQEACRLPESDKISFDIREIPTTPLNSTRALGTNMAYWKKYLADVEPCLFPSLLQGGTDTEVRFETSSLKHAVKLHDFSRLTGIPSSVVLQVAWGLVLRCFTGSEDVCFAYSRSLSQGVMLDGNSSAEPRRPVVSRLNLRDNLLVEQVLQTGTLEFDRGMQNYVPLSEVQKELGADGVLSLLNTALDCRELSTDTGNVSRLSPDKTDVHPSSDYRIVVNAEICDDSVDISFSYKADSLSDSRVSDVMDSFEHIVNSIIRNTKPRSVVGDIDFFTERSCQQVRKWNATLPEKLEKCAHEMIKKQAQSLPTSAPAVCAWDANFTYQELESMSSRLAHGLVALGVAPETFVAMCFEKSAWAVVAQLAVLKAGGAFASLDPSHPETRLKGLADDIKARLVLCSPKYHEKASRICDVALTIDGNTISDLPVPSPITSTTLPAPENAAYAIFTSGTTGTPKATVVEHIALTTASLGLAETLNMDSRSRALQFSSYTFDVSVLESIITLMTGGCVCIPSEEERMNNLSGAIRRMGANFISVPPGITNTLEPKSVPSLTTIITGGEKITESHVERWADRCVINAYGPSEATCVATASVKVDRQGNRVNDDCNSIGVALCGRAWVVDPHNYHRLVPVGAVGELVLEGSNVARGYLNNERKTNEVFVKDPEWTRNQGLRDILMRKERMYRTGDLVRYNADGTLTFISRRDTQIKFNGQRIELEEIENQCLRYLPEGTQLAVDIVIPKSKAVSKGIAAFLTLDQREPLDDASQKESPSKWLMNMSNYSADIVKQLQTSVAETLPLNMIPKYFFPVRYLPFTSSGKLDRKGLRAVVESLPKEKIRPYNLSSSSSSKQVTAGGMEGTLRSLWENVLDLTPGSVGVEDSFFGLGGDSYSAMNLVGVARSHGISLSVTDIFKYPLFKDMAKSCGVSTQVQETTLAPFSLLPGSVRTEDILEEVADQCCVDKQSISDVYPCSPVQEGLLTLSTKQHGAYIAQPIFRLADGIDLGRFKAAWQKTVNQLEILRTRIAHTEAANFVQVVLHEAPISWGSAKGLDKLPNDILELPKHNGGMLTGYTIAGSDTSSACYFVWTIHHALYDGWTVPLILRQVEENYVGSAPGKSIVPYGLFIDHLSKRDMFESDRFWKSYLSELSSSPFPQNKNPLPNAVRAGNSHNNSLDISKTSMSMDLTLPVLIRAAWAIVVAAHSGSSDVCYGETLMGRNIDLPGITEIAGPALTTVPTRVQVHNGLTISQYLQSVHKSTTEMIPHQHSGLQRIRKLNNDTASACEFQNLLVIQSDEGQLNDRLWAAEKYQTSGEFFTHPLVVECKISKTKIWTTVHHDEIVVGSWLAQNLVDQFSFVLSQLLLAPKDDVRKLNELEVFSPQDTKQVAQWNSRQPVAVDKCIHDLILERCSLRPDAMAICGWDGQLTYQELCNTAASFARYLSSRGVGAEVLVPMCLDKSIWAVVTIVSILMAGGAFLPLDPAHPTSRHEEILADMNSDIILCSPHYCSRYSKAGKNVIPINKDTIKAYGALNQNTRVPNNTTSSNMAYTLFTSGSTGRPKGIAIEHKSVLSSIMAFGPIVHLDSTSRVFQFASLTFDAAILELFAPLLFGGCLCVPSEDERLNDVAGAIRRLNVSWTFLTPAIASIIEPSTVPSLKVIACGGDAVTPEVVTKWVNCVELHNVYGPTETVIFAVINDELSSNRDPTCIGWGIPCTLTWVVDAENHNRLAPLGAVGELALEGPALAREYLGNPQKTAEAFVDEPTWAGSFPSATSHRRIYKTGDLVRYNPDGSLECLGRKDHQVKLHGQRMELGEIEYRLKEDPRVLHGLVILPKSGLLQKRLVAVLSLNSLPSEGGIVLDDLCELTSENDLANVGYPEIAEIQKGLESQLPIYMVPQTWAVIKKLPMLVSGKLDRKKITNWLENVDESLYDRIMQDYDMVKQTKTEGTVQKNEKPAVDALRNIFAHVLNLPPNKINVNRSFVSLGEYLPDSV